jgi:hypothetical protein
LKNILVRVISIIRYLVEQNLVFCEIDNRINYIYKYMAYKYVKKIMIYKKKIGHQIHNFDRAPKIFRTALLKLLLFIYL